MANTIRLKRRSSAGAAGAPASLKSGELAWNFADNIVYGGFGDDGAGNATSVLPIAGLGGVMGLTSDQSVAGVKTFLSTPFVLSPGPGDDNNKVATTEWVRDLGYVTLSARLDQFAAPTNPVAMGSQRITGLADPSSNQDAATKAYVDAAAAGLDIKPSVRLATIANHGLTGLANIDGFTPLAGDRIGVKAQSTPSQNGIYIAASGAWTRADDFTTGKVTTGAFFFVEEGSTQAGTQWVLSTTGAIVIGTTALTFTQFGAAAAFIAGGGIKLTGNTFEVEAGSGLSQDADGLRISASYVGQASITTLGTIATGVWQGTIVAMAYGGLGADISGFANNAMLKKTAGGVAAAVDGTDYLSPSATIDGGTF